MAIYFDKSPTDAQLLAKGLGTGLNNLIKNKLGDIQSNKTMNALASLGYPQEQAHGYAQLNQNAPNLLKDLSAIEQRQEATKLKRQAAFEKRNAPFIKSHAEDVKYSREIAPILDEYEQILGRNKISGRIPHLIPTEVLGSDLQRARQLSEQLANSITARQRGVQGRYKIQFARGLKPNLTQSKEAQLSGIKQLRNELGEIENRDRAYNKFLAQEKEVSNLDSAISKLAKRYKSAPELPEDAQEGNIYQDDDGSKYIVENGQLEPLD